MPAYRLAKDIAASSFGFSIYTDERIGQNGEPVQIPKIRTLDDDKRPLSPLAESFRNKGFDELPQLELILDGVMSFVGRRHVLAEEDSIARDVANRTELGRQLLRRREEIVLPAKCGVISRFAIYAHINGPSTIERRYAMDNDDHENASVGNDIRLAAYAFKSLALNELTNGANTISYPKKVNPA